MIFPQPISRTLPAQRFTLHRPSHVQAEEAPASFYNVAPVYHAHRPRGLSFMPRRFSAQLLDMGLRYGIAELIPGREENRQAFFAEEALRRYEQAEGNYAASTPACLTRFAA